MLLQLCGKPRRVPREEIFYYSEAIGTVKEGMRNESGIFLQQKANFKPEDF